MKSPLDRLQAKAADWTVTIEETRETPTSLVAFGVRAGVRVVLKIVKTSGDESHSGKVLRAFAGDGAVRVYESETDAVLLERLGPGDDLVKLVKRGDDDEATRILAHVMRKLAHHDAPAECPTVGDWGRGFDRYLESEDQQIPRAVVEEARSLYQDLESSQQATMLLHGDLQHYNVLFAVVLHPANDRHEVHRLMREGRIDLLLDHVQTGDDELAHVPLWEDELVMITARDHPRINGPRTVEQLSSEWFAVHGEPQGPGNLHELEAAIGHGPQHPLLMTRSQQELALAVATSDLVGAMTRRLAEAMSELVGLQILPLPFTMPKVNASLVWHRARENDLGHRWFRNRLLDHVPRKLPQQIAETARAA